jgi:hypothetical protein
LYFVQKCPNYNLDQKYLRERKQYEKNKNEHKMSEIESLQHQRRNPTQEEQ